MTYKTPQKDRTISTTIALTVVMFIMLVVLCGCGTSIKPTVVEKERVIAVEIPSEFLTPCPIKPPPQIDLYLKATSLERESLLKEYAVNLQTSLGVCNNQLQTIMDFQIKQKSLLIERSK
jgi:hypothetical protein